MQTFDYSGCDGKNGENGELKSYAKNGTSGTSGQDGQSGENIDLVLRTDGTRVILNEMNRKQIKDNLVLGNESNKIHLFSNGGHGGQGGKGGDGSRGLNGYSGQNATQFSSGTSGGNGTDGGDAGDGGNGGNGGNGGTIVVSAATEDMDLFMLVDQVSYQGGNAGVGGKGGFMGIGGSGGFGGNSYSWSETRDGYTYYYNNPGGMSGIPGKNGKQGVDGKNGIGGKDGIFYYSVNQQKYKARYDLSIEDVIKAESEDNIIEPGEQLKIKQLYIRNIGQMPTPISQNIIISLENNEWVNFKERNKISINKSIKEGYSHKIEGDLIFNIKDNINPAVDQVFLSSAKVNYRAKVERVNKEFPTVSNQNDAYPIRFPVEISRVSSLKSITPNEESPFAICLINRSSKPIGFDTPKKRLLNFRLLLCDTNQTIVFIPKKAIDIDKGNRNSSLNGQRAKMQKNFIIPQFHEDKYQILDQEFISSIAPYQKLIISGTLKLKNLNLPPQTQIRMQAKLDIGNYHDQQNTFQNIQANNFQIQLTESHKYQPNSDFLLIFNCETSKEFVDSIKKFALSFGGNVDLWNISNYQGFAFDFLGSNNKPLYELYKDKVVIILSNEYELVNNKKTNSITQIKEPHIYKALKDYGIKFYILGPKTYEEFWLAYPYCDQDTCKKTECKNEFFEMFLADKKDQEELEQIELDSEIKKKLSQFKNQAYSYDVFDSYCCLNPTIDDMKQKVKSTLNNIDKLNPTHSHLIGFNYEPKVHKNKTFSTEYNIGTITIIESLRKDETSFIIRNENIINSKLIDEIDEFCLIKLLPYEKKFIFFERSLKNFDNAQLIIKAIISDLCDEYTTFKNIKQKIIDLSNNLKMWNSFSLYPFMKKLTPEIIKNKITQKKNLKQKNIPEMTQKPVNYNQYIPPSYYKQSDPAHEAYLYNNNASNQNNNNYQQSDNQNNNITFPQQVQDYEEVVLNQHFQGMKNNVNLQQRQKNFKIDDSNNDFRRFQLDQAMFIETDDGDDDSQEEDGKQFFQQKSQQINEININSKLPLDISKKNQILTESLLDANYNNLAYENYINNDIEDSKEQLHSPDQTEYTTEEENVMLQIKAFLINQLIQLQITLKNQLGLSDKCCCTITSKVTDHCINLLEAVILKNLEVPEQYKKFKCKEYEKSTDIKSKRQQFNLFQTPYKHTSQYQKDTVKQNNISFKSKGGQSNKFPQFNYNIKEQIYIQDGSFMFFDETTQKIDEEKRQRKINLFENQLAYDRY